MVDGVCLTATSIEGNTGAFDVSSETLRLTTLHNLDRGSQVNVELAMTPRDRFGGHFVSGHVDGTGRILDKARRPGETRLRVGVSDALTNQMIMKGSVAVDGISLTVAGLSSGSFEVSLIPHTIEWTTLRTKNAGAEVNIECDMIGKWVKKLMHNAEGQTDGLTMEQLRENGL